MINFSLVQLETFVWVATLGGFRRAAEKLNATQPAISARIVSLEEGLGVKLFERGPGAVTLTAKGQELLAYSEKVLRMTALLQQRAASGVGGGLSLSGLLRLGVSETIVHTILPTYLSRLYEASPAIDVEITVDATVNLRNELVARSLDLAFLMGPVSEYSISNLDLAAYPLIWAASPAIGLPEGRQVKLEELAQHPILTYGRNTRPYMELKMRFAEVSDSPVRLFASSSLAAVMRMVKDGIGVAAIPRALVQDDLDSGKLVAAPCQWIPSDLRFTASFASEPPNPLVDFAATLAQRVSLESGAVIPGSLINFSNDKIN